MEVVTSKGWVGHVKPFFCHAPLQCWNHYYGFGGVTIKSILCQLLLQSIKAAVNLGFAKVDAAYIRQEQLLVLRMLSYKGDSWTTIDRYSSQLA